MFVSTAAERKAKTKEEIRTELELQHEVMKEMGLTIQNQQWPNSLKSSSNFEQKLFTELKLMNDTLSHIKSYQQFILEELRRK